MNSLTVEEQATNYETMLHIQEVRNFLNKFIIELFKRGEMHDQSKLSSPELEYFTKFTSKLATTQYGGQEEAEHKKAMDTALQHHYAKNSHHPEHFADGINDMNLIDIVEMFFDWLSATKRSYNGNIRKSIDHNANRFQMSPQLVKIFKNTVDLFE